MVEGGGISDVGHKTIAAPTMRVKTISTTTQIDLSENGCVPPHTSTYITLCNTLNQCLNIIVTL